MFQRTRESGDRWFSQLSVSRWMALGLLICVPIVAFADQDAATSSGRDDATEQTTYLLLLSINGDGQPERTVDYFRRKLGDEPTEWTQPQYGGVIRYRVTDGRDETGRPMIHVEVEFAAGESVNQIARLKLRSGATRRIGFAGGGSEPAMIVQDWTMLPWDETLGVDGVDHKRHEEGLHQLRLQVAAMQEELARLNAQLQRFGTENKIAATEPQPAVAQPRLHHQGVTLFHEITVSPLKRGAEIPLGQGSHRVEEVPRELQGKWFTPRHPYQGIMRFRVDEPQTIQVACYPFDWGGGGNPSGGWQPELSQLETLLEQGWRKIDPLPVQHTLQEEEPFVGWIVLQRECQAGEEFAIRTHKYQAPILIWGNVAD